MAGDEPGLAALVERIAGESGLDVGAYKDRCMRRRIATRMRACGAQSYEEYLRVLDERPEEFERLLDALTINVTKFFRNPETWDYLGRRILPGLLERCEGRLRAWSAGCASGEEPYTLVMLMVLVLERLGHPDWLERIRVDATDVDRECLARAEAGRYDLKAFSEADRTIPGRFCAATGPGEVEVLPELRARVQVRRFDLTGTSLPPSSYDLICCRNVVIYFDRGTQEQLMHRFADSLTPGGILVLGKVESILGGARSRFELLEPRERVYRKAA
ncbi:MAG TPA: protein-glutamate O-methyltransferase CheR [Gemmatimonadales bacterium]|nr:protein-glutamate O-methyltransferase CheR [Gemmatimonadales bacterium]